MFGLPAIFWRMCSGRSLSESLSIKDAHRYIRASCKHHSPATTKLWRHGKVTSLAPACLLHCAVFCEGFYLNLMSLDASHAEVTVDMRPGAKATARPPDPNAGAPAPDLESLSIKDAHRYIRASCKHHSPATTKLYVTALRSFLRYLYLCGDIPTDITGGLFCVRVWRLSSLSRALDADQVEALLASSDVRTSLSFRELLVG